MSGSAAADYPNHRGIEPVYPGEGRNCAAIRDAGRWRNDNLGFDEILARLEAHPVYSTLPRSELRSVAQSAAKMPVNAPRVPAPEMTFADALHELAYRRGWEVEALRAMGARDNGRGEVEFPMRDAAGNEMGFRRRRRDNGQFNTGDKALTGKGGKNGILGPLADLPEDGGLLLCEGEADVAAALSAGARAVLGTPGSRPGAKVWNYLQSVLAGREVILARDPDPAGATWERDAGKHLGAVGCRVGCIPPTDFDLDDRLRRETDKRAALRA